MVYGHVHIWQIQVYTLLPHPLHSTPINSNPLDSNDVEVHWKWVTNGDKSVLSDKEKHSHHLHSFGSISLVADKKSTLLRGISY